MHDKPAHRQRKKSALRLGSSTSVQGMIAAKGNDKSKGVVAQELRH